MTKAATQHSDNILIGAGELYLALHDATGTPGGERYIGDTVSMSLTNTVESTTVYSGDGAVAQKIEEVLRSREFTATIVLHDITAKNLALYIGGDVTEQSDIAVAVLDEAQTVNPGFWYSLGNSKTNPGGVQKITASTVVITSEDGNTTYAEDTDYKIDATVARLYIVAGGGIAANTVIKIDYTPVASTRQVIKTPVIPAQIKAAVRYIEQPSAGDGHHYYARHCNIAGGGDLALKSRDGEQQLTLTVAMLQPTDEYPTLAIDGAAA